MRSCRFGNVLEVDLGGSFGNTQVPANPAPGQGFGDVPGEDGGNKVGQGKEQAPPSSNKVPHWGQCGGEGYDGPRECEEPFICQGSQWWMDCR
jgi:hypothetical protein